MSQTPSWFQNSPASGTQYWSPMWCGCIPNSGSTLTVTVKSWSGANGTGSLVTVTSITAIDWDQSTNAQKNAFTFNNGNNASANTTQTNGSDWFKASGKYTGGAIGSLEAFCVYTGQAWIPAITSFSPGIAVAGTQITVTGSKFTDATFAQVNGVGAAFTINSDTSITLTVPAGATTGVITIGNPAGSGNSSSNLQIGNAYVRRSGVWTAPAPAAVDRSSVETVGLAYVRRSGAWTEGS